VRVSGNLAISLLRSDNSRKPKRPCGRFGYGSEAGIKVILGALLQGLTNILAYQGFLDEARATGERAVAMTSAQSDRRFQGYAEAYLSVTEVTWRPTMRARALRSCRRDNLGACASQSRPFAIALLARALLAQGRPAEALVQFPATPMPSLRASAWSMTARRRYDWPWPSA